MFPYIHIYIKRHLRIRHIRKYTYIFCMQIYMTGIDFCIYMYTNRNIYICIFSKDLHIYFVCVITCMQYIFVIYYIQII